ncbi:MAG: GntR family transcriptional regulator [Streptosporangiaceae bacterium]
MGAFADGLLPGEASLAQVFGVSRTAIRDALGILRAEGLVVRVSGCRHHGRRAEVPARPGPAAWAGRDPARARGGRQ